MQQATGFIKMFLLKTHLIVLNKVSFLFILFYFILFYFILFYFNLIFFSPSQVFLVSILFYSPPAEGMKIERSLDFGKSYQAWQYFAVDCLKTFKMADNGQLPEPDSVNCIKVPK